MKKRNRSGHSLSADGRAERHRLLLEEALTQIAQAEIVSLDLEFSGLFTSGDRQKTIDKYYEHCCKSVPQFLAVQLGVCTAKRDATDPNHWILSPFNFHLFPRQRRVFLTDSLSLQWLTGQGFDLHAWVEDGFDFQRLNVLSSEHSIGTESVKVDGAQRLIEAIIEQQKPLVVHNGFLDMLHLYDKFISPLPSGLPEFCNRLKAYFSGGIYDTKRIAEEGRISIFRLVDQGRGSTSLDSLRYHLMSRESFIKCDIDTSLSGYTDGGLNGYSLGEASMNKRHKTDKSDEATTLTKMPTSKSHEAGYDSMITLHAFLLELEWIQERGDLTKKTPDVQKETAIPMDWKLLPFCERVANSIEVVGISPGKVDIVSEGKKVVGAVEKKAVVACADELDFFRGVASGGPKFLPSVNELQAPIDLSDGETLLFKGQGWTSPVRTRSGHFRNLSISFKEAQSTHKHTNAATQNTAS